MNPPPTPTNLRLEVMSPYQIRVTVTPGDTLGEFFKAHRSINDGPFEIVNSGYPTGTVPDFIRLLPDSEVCYKVQAFNTAGVSGFTPIVMCHTPPGPPPNQTIPPPPFDLVATPNPDHTIRLSWKIGAWVGVEGQSQLIRIKRSTDGVNYVAYNSSLDDNGLTDRNVQVGTHYYYKAQAANKFGWPSTAAASVSSNVADAIAI